MYSFRLFSVISTILLVLASQQTESSAFCWTTAFYRNIRKNPSQKKMRHRPGLHVTRIESSKSSSLSIRDGDSDAVTKQTSKNFNWWRKDPRNRSVSGILISSFLSLLGFTMVAGPLTPALGKLNVWSHTEKQHKLKIALTFYPYFASD